MHYQQLRSINASVFSILVLLFSGCKDESTAPINHTPVVTSIVAFPNQVQVSDSFAVFCAAYDPDGDSLFYDWSCTNQGASIEGAPPENPFQLLNTRENFKILHAKDSVNFGAGHAAIFCDVRDGKGGLKTVTLFVAITN